MIHYNRRWKFPKERWSSPGKLLPYEKWFEGVSSWENVMSDLVEVTTTLPTQEAAMELARKLVEGKIAACAQVYGPMTSVYAWKGQVQQDVEWKLIAKTLQSQATQTMEQIRSCHSYETPEILVLPVIQSSLGYEQWVKDSVSRHVEGTAR